MSDYYNEDRKSQFIQYRKNIVTLPGYFLENLFRKTRPLEEKEQRDVCDWSVANIQDFYLYCNTPTYDSLVVMNSALKIYTDWCLSNTLVKDNQNHFNEISMDDLSGFLNPNAIQSKFIPKDKLYALVDEQKNPSDKFIILALYEGFMGEQTKDLINARTSDIYKDGDSYYFKLEGRTIAATKKLVTVAFEAAEETVYTGIGGAGAREATLINSDPERIIKPFVNSKNSDIQHMHVSIRKRVKRVSHNAGLYKGILAKDIWESGRIDMMRNLMQKYGITNVREFIMSEHIKEVDNQYAPIGLVKRYLTKYGVFF